VDGNWVEVSAAQSARTLVAQRREDERDRIYSERAGAWRGDAARDAIRQREKLAS